jgi:hypothetical protein
MMPIGGRIPRRITQNRSRRPERSRRRDRRDLSHSVSRNPGTPSDLMTREKRESAPQPSGYPHARTENTRTIANRKATINRRQPAVLTGCVFPCSTRARSRDNLRPQAGKWRGYLSSAHQSAETGKPFYRLARSGSGRYRSCGKAASESLPRTMVGLF